MKNFNRSSFFYVILCLALLSVVGTAIYRRYKLEAFSHCSILSLNKTLVLKWLSALKKDNPELSLSLASKMVPRSFPYAPMPYYFDMTRQCGISTRFFNPPFNIMDYLYWEDSFKIHNIAKSLTENLPRNSIPRTVFLSVLNRIRRVNKGSTQKKTGFLFEVWKNKKGDILDKYFLFSELMLQLGYKTQTIALFANIRKPPVHIIAEVRGYGKVYTCDFLTGQFWDKSVEDLKQNRKMLAKSWKKGWIKGLDHMLYKTEISAMSYRKMNQQLHKYLAQNSNENIPVLGLKPYSVMVNYRKSYYSNHKNNSSITFVLGIEPFSMIKNSNCFPKSWLIEKI